MSVSRTPGGLTPQPPQAKFAGARGNPEHPWCKLAGLAAQKAKVERQKTEMFVCVSCGDINCIGGECGSRW